VEVTVSAINEPISSTPGGGGSSGKSKNGAKVELICLHIDFIVQVGEISFFSSLTLSLSLTLALSGYCTSLFEKNLFLSFRFGLLDIFFSAFYTYKCDN
jgi:hypothetical protein